MIEGGKQLDEKQQSRIMLFMLLKMKRNIMGLKMTGIWSEKSSGKMKKLIKMFIISSSLRLRTYQ